jgi:hypothetical protein
MRQLFMVILGLLCCSCATSRKTVSYPALPETSPVARQTVASASGRYVKCDEMNSEYSLELNANGTYKREEYLIYCVPLSDGSRTGWKNIEEGNWTLDQNQVQLKPNSQHAENPRWLKHSFEPFKAFDLKQSGGTPVLLSRGGPFPLLLTKEPNQSAHPMLAKGQLG